jgi:hypothetical protein
MTTKLFDRTISNPGRARTRLRTGALALTLGAIAIPFNSLAPRAAAQTPAAQTSATTKRLRDVVASDALLYFEAPDFQATIKRGKDIPLARIIREEEFQVFLTPLWKMVREQIDQALVQVGEKPEQWQTCPFKSFELAVGGLTTGQPVGFYLHIETGRVGDVIKRLAQKPEYQQFVDAKEDGGVTYLTAAMPGGPPAALGISGDSIVLSITQPGSGSPVDSAKRMLQMLRGGEQKSALSSDANFQALTSKLQNKTPELTMFFRPAATLNEINNAFTKAMGMESRPAKTAAGGRPRGAERGKLVLDIVNLVANELGITAVKGVALAEGYSEGAVTDEFAVLTEGDKKGLLAFASSGKPLPKNIIDKAYDGVDSFSVSTVEPKALYDALYNSLAGVSKMFPDANFPALAMLASYEKEHNIKIGDDFFGALGPAMYSYSFPAKAGSSIPLPDSFVAIQLRDKAKFDKCMKEFMNSASQVEELKVEISEGTASRPAVYTLKFEPGSGSMPPQMAPLLQTLGLSIAVTDEWALLGFNPVAMKNELRKMAKPRDVSADVKKYFATIPADATAFSYHDWKPTIRSAWDTLSSLASMIGGEMEDFPVNLQEIPTSQSITKHLRPSVSYGVDTKDGSYSKSVGSFGFEVVGAVAAVAIPAGLMIGSRAQAHSAAFETVEPVPAPAPADPTAATRNTIKKVTVGLEVYKVEKGTYPEALSVLLASNDDHPQGYLIGFKDAPKDGWGQTLVYERAADGSSFKLRSVGANGKDERGEGDDVR